MEHNKTPLVNPSSVFSEPVEVRLAKAKDPTSPPELLQLLAKDRFWYVRDYVASNLNAPCECLELLRNDPDFRVRVEAEQTLQAISKSGISASGLPTSLTLVSQNTSKESFKGVNTMLYSTDKYARYLCGDLDRVVSWKEMQAEKALHPESDMVDFARIFNGIAYPTLSESVSAQIDKFGWQFDDDRRLTEPGGSGPMSPDKLRRILHTRAHHPYDNLNFYYAWKTPDNRLFMIGTESTQSGEILLYEYSNYFKEYGGRFTSIRPGYAFNGGQTIFVHDHPNIEKLASQVSQYEYLGSWRDPDRLMDDKYGLGKVLACGRWKLAQEHILDPKMKKEFNCSGRESSLAPPSLASVISDAAVISQASQEIGASHDVRSIDELAR